MLGWPPTWAARLQGSRCPESYVAAAVSAAAGLAKYEGAAALEAVCSEGAEPAPVRAALTLPQAFAAAECSTYDADFKARSASLLCRLYSSADTAPPDGWLVTAFWQSQYIVRQVYRCRIAHCILVTSQVIVQIYQYTDSTVSTIYCHWAARGMQLRLQIWYCMYAESQSAGMQIHEDAATAAAAAAAEKAAEEAFVAGRGSPSGGSPTASSGSKTPRAEAPYTSPNQRLRKARRAEELQHPPAHKVTTRHHADDCDASNTGAHLHNTRTWKVCSATNHFFKWSSLPPRPSCAARAMPGHTVIPTRIDIQESMKSMCYCNWISRRGHPVEQESLSFHHVRCGRPNLVCACRMAKVKQSRWMFESSCETPGHISESERSIC